MRIVRWIAFAAFFGMAAIGLAQASCQPKRLSLECPVGDEVYSRYIGCEDRQLSLINDETIWVGYGGMNRHQCGVDNFPIYRRFTHDERERLKNLVRTQEYQSLKNDGYGTTAVWLEQQLTGKIDPEWHGELTLWDAMPNLFVRAGVPEGEDDISALQLALPLFISATEKSNLGGSERARDFARIAYLQYHVGQRDVAIGSMQHAIAVLGEKPTDVQNGAKYEAARGHLNFMNLCLEGPVTLRNELCDASGLIGLSNKMMNCAGRESAPCPFWPTWNGTEMMQKIQEARLNFRTFKTAFDAEIMKSVFSGRRRARRRGHLFWNRCHLVEALGKPCPNSSMKLSSIALAFDEYFPDLYIVIREKARLRELQSFASTLEKCRIPSTFCQAVLGDVEPDEAAKRIVELWPDFSNIQNAQ